MFTIIENLYISKKRSHTYPNQSPLTSCKQKTAPSMKFYELKKHSKPIPSLNRWSNKQFQLSELLKFMCVCEVKNKSLRYKLQQNTQHSWWELQRARWKFNHLRYALNLPWTYRALGVLIVNGQGYMNLLRHWTLLLLELASNCKVANSSMQVNVMSIILRGFIIQEIKLKGTFFSLNKSWSAFPMLKNFALPFKNTQQAVR